MPAEFGRNERIRVLDDFVCEAIPGPLISTAESCGMGMNAGVHVPLPLAIAIPSESSGQPATVEWRKWSTEQLHSFLLESADRLSPDELELVHDIAADRLGQSNDPFNAGAGKLLRAVLLVALKRIA